jgi:hypothetical protein
MPNILSFISVHICFIIYKVFVYVLSVDPFLMGYSEASFQCTGVGGETSPLVKEKSTKNTFKNHKL